MNNSWGNGIEIGPNATGGCVITSASTASDAIVINGDASATDTTTGGLMGILLNENNTISATAGGGISLTGRTNAAGTTSNKYDILFGPGAAVLANSGNISITGSTAFGISGAGTLSVGYKAGSAVTSSTSSITLMADKLTLAGTDRIQSSGTLTVKPYSASTAISIAGAAGVLLLPSTYFSTNFKNGLS